MVSLWSFKDNKSLKSPGLFSVFWPISIMQYFGMVSTRSIISKFSSPYTNPLVTAPRVPITIGIRVTFTFHSFFNSLAKVKGLISLFTFFQFYFVVRQYSKVHNSASIFFLFFNFLIIIRSGRLAEIWWSVCISKSLRSFGFSFSWTNSGLCIYHLFIWSNFNFLHDSQWVTLPTQSCLVLYSFCASFLHSLIMSFFRLNHHITYICYFVTSYQFSLWYG